MTKTNKSLLALVTLLLLTNGTLYAQTDFPGGNFWALHAGLGMSDILVKGSAFQAVIDPRLWLSPPLMVGSKAGFDYSSEKDSADSNILTFEGQVYARWNFLRLGSDPVKTTNVFVQGGLGLIAAYRGTDRPFDDVTMTRGSLLAEAALGVTIPLADRWQIEPSIRGGYPHIAGVSVTAGYKFPLPQKTAYETRYETKYETRYQTVSTTKTEYVEVVKMLPPEEIIKRMMITSIEYILFGPDIGRYNIGIDNDARGLNELVLTSTAQMLDDNRNLRVRIEGHANPITTDPNEADELMSLGSIRASAVADQLRAKGVNEEQMVIISFGGTRTVTSDHEIWNRNRRVELTIIEVDTN